MKKVLVLAILFSVAFASLAFAAKTQMTAKVGDELFVCACGDDCKCDTMSRNAGKCTCGKDMVKAKVTKVEKGKLTVDSRKRPFASVGKFACACGPDCKCDTISQNAGNCTCGKPMAAVKMPTKAPAKAPAKK
jgi:hypothetical protein